MKFLPQEKSRCMNIYINIYENHLEYEYNMMIGPGGDLANNFNRDNQLE